MASSIIGICDICEAKQKENLAGKWCPECEEKLCDDCTTNHTISKATRHHILIDIENYQKLPTSMKQVEAFCKDHEMKFTNFCTQHDVLYCPACVHHKCSGTHLLKDVILAAKSSSLLQTIEENMTDMKENMRKVIIDRQDNIKSLKEQQIQIVSDIKRMREKMTDHLLILENRLITEILRTEKNQTTKIKSLISDLQHKIDNIDICQEEVQSVKEYGSDLQIFLMTKTTEAAVEREKTLINDVIRSGDLERVELKCELYKKVMSFVSGISTLGTVSVKTQPSTVPLTTREYKQAQIKTISGKQPVPIEDIKLSLKTSFKLTNVDIRGCSILRNRRIVIADVKKHRLVLLKENGKIEKEIPVQDGPFDVVVIDNNIVAASTADGLTVTNIENNRVEKTINTGTCEGLDYYNGSLICCVRSKGMMSVDLSSSSFTTLVKYGESYGLSYCAINDDKIYLTRSYNDIVTCFTMKGKELWEFSNRAVINTPLGITVDTYSNVYVASYGNNTVVVLSPDGQRHRTILAVADGLRYPWSVHYDRTNNTLLVFNHFGEGFIYKM